jgi:hypothetical protein
VQEAAVNNAAAVQPLKLKLGMAWHLIGCGCRNSVIDAVSTPSALSAQWQNRSQQVVTWSIDLHIVGVWRTAALHA